MGQITVVYKDFEEMKAVAREILKGEVEREEQSRKSVKKEIQKVETPEYEPDEPKPTKEKKEEVSYTLQEVRARLAVLTKTGKKAQVQELLNSFGAEKLSQIGQENYPELMRKAGEL